MINKRLRELLEEYRARLYKLSLNDYPDAASLKNALLQKPRTTDAPTLQDLICDRMTRFEAEGRINYAKIHRDSLKVYGVIIGNPLLSSIRGEHIRRLSTEMQTRGYSSGSRQMRLAHLKAAINEAIAVGLVKYEVHPFAGFTMPSPGKKQTDLTIAEFQKLRDAVLVSTRACFARDMFLLSFYLGGINLVDLLEVDLSGDELRYIRTKTKNKKSGDAVTVFKIPEEARPLIRRHAPNGRLVWPGSRDRYEIVIAYINNCFMMLRKETGITPLSYYSARHTFGQLAYEVGTPLEIVEYLLGQTMKTNRPIYNYVRVMQRQADKAIRNVIEYTINPSRFETYI